MDCDTVEEICSNLRQRNWPNAKKIYQAHTNCGYEEASNVIDNLEIEMIKNNEFPDRPPEEALALCGVCKNLKLRKGVFLHGIDEWIHWRLYVCSECMTTLPMQKSLHELCYECREHLPEGCIDPGLEEELGDMIIRFEKAHAILFNKLPPSTTPDYQYPGSLSRNLDNWLKEHKPD